MLGKPELQNKISFSANLWLEGEDLVPDDVTHCLGVEPDTSWKRGDPCKNPEKPVWDRGGWGFRIRGEWGQGLEAVLGDLLVWFKPKETELARLSAQFNGHVAFGLFYQTRHICSPSLGLPTALVKKLGDLNLDVYVNVYPCSTPGSEGESSINDSQNTCCEKC